MPDFVDYNTVLDDVVAMVTNVIGLGKDDNTKFTVVARDMNETEFNTSILPACDVRLSAARPQPSSGQVYYVPVSLELEVAAFDLSQRAKAGRIVLDLTNRVQRAFVENAHWGAVWDSIILGEVTFLTSMDRSAPGDGAFVASAIIQVTVNVYSQ